MIPLVAELLIDVLLLTAEIGGASIALKLLSGVGFQRRIGPVGLVDCRPFLVCGSVRSNTASGCSAS